MSIPQADHSAQRTGIDFYRAIAFPLDKIAAYLDAMVAVDAEFRGLVEEVAAAHGVDSKKDGGDWQFAQDFSKMIFVPAPAKPKEPDKPAEEKK